MTTNVCLCKETQTQKSSLCFNTKFRGGNRSRANLGTNPPTPHPDDLLLNQFQPVHLSLHTQVPMSTVALRCLPALKRGFFFHFCRNQQKRNKSGQFSSRKNHEKKKITCFPHIAVKKLQVKPMVTAPPGSEATEVPPSQLLFSFHSPVVVIVRKLQTQWKNGFTPQAGRANLAPSFIRRH